MPTNNIFCHKYHSLGALNRQKIAIPKTSIPIPTIEFIATISNED